MSEIVLTIVDKLAGLWLNWRMDRQVRQNNRVGEMNLKKVEFDENGFHLIASFPGVVLLADEAAAMLDANNAKNYLQFDMQPRLDRGKRPIRVTVQWASGESPAAKAARLEQETERLRAEVETWMERARLYHNSLVAQHNEGEATE